MPRPKHLAFVDGLRAAAALLVIFHHAWLQSWPFSLYPEAVPSGLTAALTGWLAFGKIAVTAFIVISGFCLMLPVVRYGKEIDAGRFLLRRAHRILPTYFVAVGLVLLLDLTVIYHPSGTVYDGFFPLTVGGVLSHLFLVQNFSSNPFQIAGPFWSIAVECQIYLLFPLFIRVYHRYGLAATISLTSALGFALSFLFANLGMQSTYSHYIVMFGFGMAAAHFAFRWKASGQALMVKVCYALIPVTLVAGVGFHHQLGSNKLVTDTLVGLLVAICLILASTRPAGWIARSLSIKPLAWIGSFSYSLYLVHVPLQQIIWQLTAHPAGWSRLTSFLFISTVGTAVILLVAWAFFWAFERPFLQGSTDGSRRVVIADLDTLPLATELEA
jgi:peptidoglycan/LPS O-acetylase OafA/YrhL